MLSTIAVSLASAVGATLDVLDSVATSPAMRRLRKVSRGSQLFGLMLPRCTSKLLPEPTPVETGWDAVSDVEQRSPTRVGVVRVVELVGVLPTGSSILYSPTFGQPTARDLFLQAIAPDARCITRSRGSDAELDVVCINQKTGAFLYRLSEI